MKITPPPTPHRAPTAVGGDLEGSTATPVVTGIQGTPVDSTTPTPGQVFVFDGTSWVPTTPTVGSVSPLTTKGDLWGYSTLDARVPVGSDGQVLTADSTDAEGVTWQTPVSIGPQHVHVNNVTFSGDASRTVFTLPAAPVDAYSIAVFVAGTRSQDWALSGTILDTLTFGSAPASGTDNIAIDIVATL